MSLLILRRSKFFSLLLDMKKMLAIVIFWKSKKWSKMVIFGYFRDFGKTWKTLLLSTIVSCFWRFLRTLGDGIGIYLEKKIGKREKTDFWENFAKLFTFVFLFRSKMSLFVKIAQKSPFLGPPGNPPCFLGLFSLGAKNGVFDVF